MTSNGTKAWSNGLIVWWNKKYRIKQIRWGVNAIVNVKGAIAQPYLLSEYNAEKINLDDAIALQNILIHGVQEALSPEAIIWCFDEEQQFISKLKVRR